MLWGSIAKKGVPEWLYIVPGGSPGGPGARGARGARPGGPAGAPRGPRPAEPAGASRGAAVGTRPGSPAPLLGALGAPPGISPLLFTGVPHRRREVSARPRPPDPRGRSRRRPDLFCLTAPPARIVSGGTPLAQPGRRNESIMSIDANDGAHPDVSSAEPAAVAHM